MKEYIYLKNNLFPDPIYLGYFNIEKDEVENALDALECEITYINE